MVAGAVIGLIAIVAVFVALGWFISRAQARSERRFDQNNMAGTLRTHPYRRPHRDPHRGRGRDSGPSDD